MVLDNISNNVELCVWIMTAVAGAVGWVWKVLDAKHNRELESIRSEHAKDLGIFRERIDANAERIKQVEIDLHTFVSDKQFNTAIEEIRGSYAEIQKELNSLRAELLNVKGDLWDRPSITDLVKREILEYHNKLTDK